MPSIAQRRGWCKQKLGEGLTSMKAKKIFKTEKSQRLAHACIIYHGPWLAKVVTQPRASQGPRKTYTCWGSILKASCERVYLFTIVF